MHVYEPRDRYKETPCMDLYVFICGQFVSLNCISIFAYAAIWLMHCKQI